jgi:hypothetical protein
MFTQVSETRFAHPRPLERGSSFPSAFVRPDSRPRARADRVVQCDDVCAASLRIAVATFAGPSGAREPTTHERQGSFSSIATRPSTWRHAPQEHATSVGELKGARDARDQVTERPERSAASDGVAFEIR